MCIQISGAVWSQVVTYWFLAGVLVIYIKVASIQEQTWGGWTVEGLYDWNEIVHLGIPGIIFTIMEWSCFDIPSLVAGLLGDDQLAVYSIIWQVLNISIMPCFSMARIVIVRVGNFLGKYEPSHARIAGRVALLINVISTIIIVIIVVCMRNILPLLFTSDKYIVQLTSSTLPVLVLLIPYSNAITQAAILQGIGHQRTVAIYSFIVYYLIGLPIGFFLIFVVKTGMVGYWIGIFLASVCQSLFYDIAITRIDWVQEAEKAHMRAYINIQGKYTTSLNTSDDDFAEDYIIENLNSKSNYHYDATYDGQNESTSLCMKENGSTKSFSTNERPVIKSIIMKRIAVLVCMIIVLIVGVLIESSMTSRVREFMKEELNVDFNATSIE
ncbi:multidrug and toxin extrusion protein 1-like [Saccoglossus kowalevskii]